MSMEAAAPDEVFSITRTFDAPRELVFQAWTEPERLAQWWGPKGMEVSVESIDLRPGGIFHYAMATPGGKMWGRFVYQEIEPPAKLSFISSFSDENAGVVRAPFSPHWPLENYSIIELTEEGGKTNMSFRGWPINATEEERKAWKDMFSSMQGGWGGTLEKLEEYLRTAQG